MGQAPAEELGVGQRNEVARRPEIRGRANERLEVVGRLRDRVGEVRDARRVAGDAPETLHDVCPAVRDRLAQLAGSIVAVHPDAQGVAGGFVVTRGRADGISRHRELERFAVHRGKRAANIEAELGVQAERPVVIGNLDQPDARGASFDGPFEHRCHERAAHAVVLRGGIDADRPQPRDGGPLVEEVAAQDVAVALRDHAVDPRMVDQVPDRLGRRRDRREVRRESVARRNGGERLVADAPALLPVVRHCLANREAHPVPSEPIE